MAQSANIFCKKDKPHGFVDIAEDARFFPTITRHRQTLTIQ